MIKEKVIIFGIGQISEVLYCLLKKDPRYEPVAFCADEKYLTQTKIKFELPTIPFEEIDAKYSQEEFHFTAPVSYKNLNKDRSEVFLKIKEKGYSLINYISEDTTFNGKLNAENIIILEKNNIQPFVEINNNCFIWSFNHLGHHSVIKENVFISSGVIVSGNVTVEENCFLGVNSSIKDNLNVGKNCLITAGSVVSNNLKDNSVVSNKSTKLLNIDSSKIRF